MKAAAAATAKRKENYEENLWTRKTAKRESEKDRKESESCGGKPGIMRRW